MDCLPVCQRGLPKKVGIRYNEHNSNMNEATVNKTDITVCYLRSYELLVRNCEDSKPLYLFYLQLPHSY